MPNVAQLQLCAVFTVAFITKLCLVANTIQKFLPLQYVSPREKLGELK